MSDFYIVPPRLIVGSLQRSNVVTSLNTLKGDLSFKVSPDTGLTLNINSGVFNLSIQPDFYIKKSILDELLEGGIKSLFDTYVTPSKSYGDLTTTLDDLQQYSEYNIAPRFIIDNVKVFAKEGKNLTTSFINQVDPNLIDTDIYKIQTNYATEGFVQDRLSFRLIYNKKPSHNYEFKVVVKIIA